MTRAGLFDTDWLRARYRWVLAPAAMVAIGVVMAGCGGDAGTAATSASDSGSPATPDANGADAAQPSVGVQPQCDDTTPCASGKFCAAGICVVAPATAKDADLTDPTNDYLPSSEAMQLGCVDQSTEAQLSGLAGPQSVTMWGRVDRFGGGPVTANIAISVFKLADFHPEVCTAIADDDARAACLRSDKVGKPIAQGTSIDPSLASAKSAGLDLASAKQDGDACSKHLECPSGYECRKESGAVQKVCVKTHGIYAVEGVPTNTRLVIRVHGLNSKDNWHDSYYWDVVLFSNRLDTVGTATQPVKYVGQDTYRTNPTIVGEGQWVLVPTTLGIGEIPFGHGVIGGRVRDCGVPAGRGGWAIHGAKVGLAKLPKALAYFNDNEDDTVPVKSNAATDTLGRFAAVDLAPGPNRVAAVASVGGKTVSLGGVDVYVIPDALMIVSLPGRVPVLSK